MHHPAPRRRSRLKLLLWSMAATILVGGLWRWRAGTGSREISSAALASRARLEPPDAIATWAGQSKVAEGNATNHPGAPGADTGGGNAPLASSPPSPARVVVLDRGLSEPDAKLVRGSTLMLPLPNADEVEGRVNLVLHDADGTIRVGGAIPDRGGSFSLAWKEGAWAGRILLPRVQTAYELASAGAGRIELRAKPLADVMCYPLPPEHEGPVASAPSALQTPVPLLSSRPTATAVLYLDFDGETVTDPDWNDGVSIVAAPSSLTNAQITEVWNRVKEDYIGFNLDITTDLSRYTNAPVGRRMRCIVTPTYAWFGPAGGVAYVNSFNRAGQSGFTTTIPCWVFNSTVVGIAEAVSHELGHTLGLHHDGDSRQQAGTTGRYYYPGHGSGAVSWGPIMGASYSRSVVQWSKGEYAGADNQEDDIAIIAGAPNGFGFIADEAGDTRATATALGLTAGTLSQSGVIASSADVDFYSFAVTVPTLVNISASPAAISPNLDLALELQDANGTVLTSANPDLALTADFSLLVAAGTYYVKVQGVGRGSVLGDGYSSYGCAGQYTLSGALGSGFAPVIAGQLSNSSALVQGTAMFSVRVYGSAPLAYQWRKNGVELHDGDRITGATTGTLVVAGLTLDDAGDYAVVVSNPAGSATSTTATLTVALPGPPTIITQPTVGVGGGLFGGNATLTIEATGEGFLHYQWYRNGVALPGATGASLYLPNIGLADLGNYYVEVSNGGLPVVSRTTPIVYQDYTGAASFWTEARESGGIVYFLFATPARVLRYDLAAETWLPPVALSATPSALAVADDAVYVAFGSRVARLDRAVANETTFVTMSLAVTGLVVAGDYLVVATTDPTDSEGVQLNSYRRGTGQKMGDKSLRYKGSGFSYSATAGRIYWGIMMTAVIDANGGWGDAFDGPPYTGFAWQGGSHTMLLGNGTLVASNSGIVRRAADLVYAGSFGSAIDDLCPEANGEGSALRGATAWSYDAKLRRTASFQLSRYAFRMWRNASGLLAFAHPAAVGGTPNVEKIGPTQWRASAPAMPLEAMGRRVTPSRMVLDEQGVLYVYSAAVQNIFRWSIAGRKYLPPIPLLDPAKYLAYSAENRALYTDNGGNLVRRVRLASTALLEAPFASSPLDLTGLQTAGPWVFFSDPSGAWQTHYTVSSTGDPVASVQWTHRSGEFTWSPATNRMFFFRDDTAPNDLHYEVIKADGKFDGGGDTPYHGGVGTVLPIRVAPDGGAVLLGSGEIYEGAQLTRVGSLGSAFVDAAWEGGAIHTIRNQSGTTQISSYSPATLQSLREANYLGVPLRLFALGSGQLLLVTDVGGYLNYRVLAAATLALIQIDDTSAAPVAAAPQFIAHPVGQETVPGGVATFTTVALSQTPLAYQWRRGGTALIEGGTIAGTTASTLVLRNVQSADLGSIDVVVTNTVGTVTSLAAPLSFAAPPVITTPSSVVTVTVGKVATLAVMVTGSAPMSYQWKRNGVVVLDSATVSGASTATLSLTNVPLSAAGTYAVTVSNQAGTATATVAELTVFVPVPPSITAHPQGATVGGGESVTLSVAATGTAPLSYFWTKNYATIAGATSATFMLSNFQSGDAGTYRAYVNNAVGSVTSSPAVLILRTAPALDAQPVDQHTVASATAFFGVTATGGDLTYRWQRRPAGSGSWATLADDGIYSGSNTNVLAVAFVDAAMEGAQFRCLVFNPLGSVTSQAATLSILASSPAVAVFAGGIGSKILKADGTLWGVGSNGSGGIGDGTTTHRPTPTYVTDHVATVAIGYSHSLFIKTDGSLWGCGNNSAGQLGDGTQESRPTPVLIAIDVVGMGAGGSHSAYVKSDGTFWTMGGNDYGQLGDGTQLWRKVPAQIASGVAKVSVRETVTVFVASDAKLWGMGVGDLGQLGNGTNARSLVPVLAIPSVSQVATGGNHTLIIKTDGSLWATGGNYQGALGDGTGTSRLSPVPVAPAALVAAAGFDHSLFIKPDHTLWAMGSNGEGQLGDGTTINRWSPVQVANGVVAAAAGTKFSLFVKADGSVWGMGYNGYGQLGDGTYTRRTSPVQILGLGPPVITASPQGQTVNAGQSVTFAVTVNGFGAVNYAWRKDGLPVVGATNATLTLAAAQPPDAGNYSVAVSNANGGLVSMSAALLVIVPAVAPALASAPLPVAASIGATATFNVVATGTAPLTYQWRKNTFVISGATTAALILGNLQTGDAGNYDVVVTNAVGAVTTPPAALTVSPVPAIISAPQSQTVNVGANATFNVSAGGLAPLTYQWEKDGVPIAGATNASLTLAAVAVSTAGRYSVIVTNPAGSVTSSEVFLVVQNGTVDLVGGHALVGPGYIAGRTVTITNTISYGGVLERLGWQVLLPVGWSYGAGSGDEGAVKPRVGDANLAEWTWSVPPPSPITFTYTLDVPATAAGVQSLAALISAAQGGNGMNQLAQPDPLVVGPITYHSADTDRNFRLSLLELTRMIELYNVRYGTTRTGAYAVAAGATEDDFAPEPTRALATAVTLTRYHSADSNHDGKLSLVELTRVIELYNTRSGTTRTGAYHVLTGTEDGFAAGP